MRYIDLLFVQNKFVLPILWGDGKGYTKKEVKKRKKIRETGRLLLTKLHNKHPRQFCTKNENESKPTENTKIEKKNRYKLCVYFVFMETETETDFE